MPKKTGYADLPLHTGTVPKWLADRMRDLGTQIIEALLIEYGRKEVLRRLSDPLWFQSLGAVLGMDWHSSGITTSVMYALKRGINARAKEFGLVICGGRGKYSRETPSQLEYMGEHTGLDAAPLIRASKLCAKVDNTAVQDGFQLYLHNFILSADGDWAVVQQGMNPAEKKARRYHWCSQNLKSFTEEPHSGVTGENEGKILNLTDANAADTRESILNLAKDEPRIILKEASDILRLKAPKDFQEEKQLTLFAESPCKDTQLIIENSRNCIMPAHHEVRAEDVDLKRLGAVLATAYESQPKDFESLLLTKDLGPRTLQSLTLVSEVIHGTPSRFRDPARFSFAHGGKDGHPFPVPLNIYDESIRILGDSIEKSKLGYKDKSECLKRLHKTALQIEKNCSPQADFDKTIAREKEHSIEWGGRTVSD
ncbi:MAG TPA: DUF763 domain-containing protein [Treponema sp.]|nr:DUF763 domain-containing protein [Treponema sp.]